MSNKHFTKEEKAELASNPYTRKVTEKTLSFTVPFKEAFWERYQNGEAPKAIFESMGYREEVIGRKRIENTALRVREEGEKGEGFHEGYAKRKPSRKDYSQMTEKESMKAMQTELTYLRQEVEFLKKLAELINRKKSVK